MKSFLHERRFIARDFDLDDWIDTRPLVDAYRLEGLEDVGSGLQGPVEGHGTALNFPGRYSPFRFCRPSVTRLSRWSLVSRGPGGV